MGNRPPVIPAAMRKLKYVLTRSNGQDKSEDKYYTKKEVERAYASWLRFYRKSSRYSVQVVRMGYFKYTYFGEYGTFEGEVYISRLA